MAIGTRISQALHALPKPNCTCTSKARWNPNSPYGWPTVTA